MTRAASSERSSSAASCKREGTTNASVERGGCAPIPTWQSPLRRKSHQRVHCGRPQPLGIVAEGSNPQIMESCCLTVNKQVQLRHHPRLDGCNSSKCVLPRAGLGCQQTGCICGRTSRQWPPHQRCFALEHFAQPQCAVRGKTAFQVP